MKTLEAKQRPKYTKLIQYTLTSDFASLLIRNAEEKGSTKSGISRTILKEYLDKLTSGSQDIWLPREHKADRVVRHDYTVETFVSEEVYALLKEISDLNNETVGRFSRLVMMGYLYENGSEL